MSASKQHDKREEVEMTGIRTLLLAAGACLGCALGPVVAEAGTRACDDSLKTAFRPDAQTTVVFVKVFKKGEKLQLSPQGMSQGASGPPVMLTPNAPNDLCMVKLNVGPGNPGPADAPSTSAGIGIEIWLPPPANWNGRIHAIGGGGWVGGPAGSPTAIADMRVPLVAGTEGAVSSFTDSGHSGVARNQPSSGGDFAMNPDGAINKVLWTDLSLRSLHEQALKTKALTEAFYGKPAKFAYWDGASQGGRQAYALAQSFPNDYDGIIGNMPAINFTRLATAGIYAQILFQRELGGVPISEAQQDLVSNAAIHACDNVGGLHLGYIMDMAACRYDPTKDAQVLCPNDGGANTTPDCVSRAQAVVFNKIWYGLTEDGSAPDPALDNGWDKPVGGVRRWFGATRGTSLYDAFYSHLFHVNAGMASVAGPWTLGTDVIALELQNPTMASPSFKNASGDGADLWKTLSYAQFANAFDRGVALDPVFGHTNTDNPDLSAFKARGGKLLSWNGLNDEMVMAQGVMQYYDRVEQTMGGPADVQSFYRLYILPGNGHGSPNGTSNPAAHPPVFGPSQFYDLLVNWVENGVAPGDPIIHSPPGSPTPISQPACAYPSKATFVSGDPPVASSYKCAKALKTAEIRPTAEHH
jgi:feruloyl esterase